MVPRVRFSMGELAWDPITRGDAVRKIWSRMVKGSWMLRRIGESTSR